MRRPKKDGKKRVHFSQYRRGKLRLRDLAHATALADARMRTHGTSGAYPSPQVRNVSPLGVQDPAAPRA